MIRRQVGEEFFLITQNDHAVVAGRLAEHVGNDKFARPAPWESVVLAIRMHDSGWPLHDEQPTLNDRGLPLDVFESPRAITLKTWAASAERAAQIDAYAGLLVSMHSLGLSIMTAASHSADPATVDAAQLSERFEMNKFQHREVERQERLRRRLGMRTDLPLTHGLAEAHASDEDDQLVSNFRLLQAMDLASLCLCCAQPPTMRSQDVFPLPGGPPWHLQFHRDVEGKLRVDPWPFDVGSLSLSVPVRRIPKRQYRDERDFHETLAIARADELPLMLRAP